MLLKVVKKYKGIVMIYAKSAIIIVFIISANCANLNIYLLNFYQSMNRYGVTAVKIFALNALNHYLY